MMQGRYDTGGTGLPDLRQADGIIGAEPTPGLFHWTSFFEDC
jgi:hypothetical protein